ncbi:MAG TPA: MFS transporter, partial [Turneriella sp.]|nr:MFS transporter [Turneriella sp.]
VALFAVGMSAAIVQGGLLGVLIKKFGEVSIAKVGLFFATLEFLLFGLAPQGFYMYIIMAVCILANAAGPALQAHVSRCVPAHKQGIAMGSLSSIASIAQVLAPFMGLTLLSKYSHAPGALQTVQAGIPFFGSALLQFIAFALALIYFAREARGEVAN